jgi:amino acid transporter
MGSTKQTVVLPQSNRVRLVVASSVMLTFISFWRAAAIVLNDLGSSAFYAGGLAEEAVGKSAPWLILGVVVFAYAVRAVYVESCSMFTRGGVYRIVKEALGGTFAKVSVSALMFDYVLTGPISGVSAGHYIVGMLNDLAAFSAERFHWAMVPHLRPDYSSAAIAVMITIYFWWQNTKGIEESSEKALDIMKITTVMVVILLVWGLITIVHRGAQLPPLPIPSNLHFSTDALGFLKGTKFATSLGLFGVLMAFGHSVLAMSGEESLAQVNREIEHPKLKNLKRAALVIAVYSFFNFG